MRLNLLSTWDRTGGLATPSGRGRREGREGESASVRMGKEGRWSSGRLSVGVEGESSMRTQRQGAKERERRIQA